MRWFLVMALWVISMPATAEAVSINGKVYADQLFVRLSVAGSDSTEQFLVDSGAKQSLINDSVARRWRQKFPKLPEWYGWGMTIPFLQGDSLYSAQKWEGVPLEVQGISVGPTDFFILTPESDLNKRRRIETSDGAKIAGILGSDFLSRCVLTLQGDSATLQCDPDLPATPKYFEWTKVVNGTTIRILLDTGSSYAMVALGTKILSLGLPQVTNSTVTIQDGAVQESESSENLTVFSFPDIETGSPSTNVVVLDTPEPRSSPTPHDLYVGLPYIKERQATVDFVNHSFSFSRSFSDNSEFSRLAWDAHREGPTFRFDAVLPGSSLARVGVLPGDLLLMYNDTSIAEVSDLSGFVQTVLRGTVKSLQVLRGSATVVLARQDTVD